MSRQPSPDDADGHSLSAASAPAIDLEPRVRSYAHGMLFARRDIQQDIIDKLKPVDDDRLKEGMPDTEFNRKYPPDAWCEEAAPNARVWKVCKDEANASDRDMLDSWNKTLDVLLIFAGLFSAVSTAFLVESYKTLQPDYSQYVAGFLYSAAVAYSNNGSVLPPLDAILSPERSFQSNTVERWINGLWFISLTVSLLVALLSILVKQWLDEYRARVSRSAPDHAYWTRRHALYHNGLRAWGVPVIISCLPLLLHVSLFLFLAGLVLFLRVLDGAIARAILVIVALILALYLLSMILPAYYSTCPSVTPVLMSARHSWSGWMISLRNRLSRLSASPTSMEPPDGIEPWVSSIEAKEAQVVLEAEDRLTAIAVADLVNRTDEPDVLAVVAEAIGAFRPRSLQLFLHEQSAAYERVHLFVNLGRSSHIHPTSFAVASFARRLRTYMALLNISPRPVYADYVDFDIVHTKPDLQASLGIEGALLYVLYKWEPTFTEDCGIRNLVAALRNMDWSRRPETLEECLTPREPGLHHSFCLLFLQTAARIAELSTHGYPLTLSLSPHFYSFVIVTFCAARFAERYGSRDETVAAGYLTTIFNASIVTLSMSGCISPVITGARDKGPNYYQRLESDIVKVLCAMLCHDQYNIHPDVATLVAPCVASFAASLTFWSYGQVLSGFILSERFEKYTTTVEGVAAHADALSDLTLDGAACGPQGVKDFLLCSSILASRAESLNFTPAQSGAHIRRLLSVIARHLYHSSGGHEDVNQIVVLSHFLGDTAVLDRWMDISWHCFRWSVLPLPIQTLARRLAVLAGPLASTLRRRVRMNLEVDPSWVHVLFSNRVTIQIAESALDIFAAENQADSADYPTEFAFALVGSFLRHWRQLSPSLWSRMCDHLCDSHRESALDLEVVERFRSGLFPGDINGASQNGCYSDCTCMRPLEPDFCPLSGTRMDRWSHRLKR